MIGAGENSDLRIFFARLFLPSIQQAYSGLDTSLLCAPSIIRLHQLQILIDPFPQPIGLSIPRRCVCLHSQRYFCGSYVPITSRIRVPALRPRYVRQTWIRRG
jgi:hypothetical protein